MLVILHHSGFVSILAQLIMINDIVSKKCRNTIFPRKKQKISLINDLQCRNEIISFAKREPKTFRKYYIRRTPFIKKLFQL